MSISSQWYDPPGKAVGAAIIIHGLNNLPDSMASFVAPLQQAGLACLLVSLAGHGANENLYSTTAEDWLEDLSAAHQAARARYPHLPLFNLSYSLGALLSVALLHRFPEFNFSRCYLLAPAIEFTKWAAVRSLLSPLRYLGLALPSTAPRSVRRHNFTPLQSYHALLTLARNCQKLSPASAMGRMPTRILVHNEDELVSRVKLEQWIAGNRLFSWSFAAPPEDFHQACPTKHLLIDKPAFSPGDWHWLTADIVSFFKES